MIYRVKLKHLIYGQNMNLVVTILYVISLFMITISDIVC